MVEGRYFLKVEHTRHHQLGSGVVYLQLSPLRKLLQAEAEA